jgi:hypothetical protein
MSRKQEIYTSIPKGVVGPVSSRGLPGKNKVVNLTQRPHSGSKDVLERDVVLVLSPVGEVPKLAKDLLGSLSPDELKAEENRVPLLQIVSFLKMVGVV